MRFKLIACNVFFREISHLAAKVPAVLDPVFTEKGDHEDANKLRSILQAHIDAAAGRDYDAVLLAYGLCGNSCAGLRAATQPLVVPRAHDCCTIFLGSKERFKEHFADNPSRQFSSAGYLERGADYGRTSDVGKTLGLDKTYEDYVKLYGEENALYIMETLAPARDIGKSEEVVYIDIPETAHLGWMDVCRRRAEEDGKSFRVLPGSIALLEGLLRGVWKPADFLVVPPGKTIEPVYDWDEVLRAV